MRQPEALELRLLLAVARAHPSADDEAAIRRLLSEPLDWPRFAKKALDHGLACLAGHTLARVAPDLVPQEILNAFGDLIATTRANNQEQLNELALIIQSLARAGVQTIPFKGPVLALEAFGDLGLRGFRDLDFLIHDGDVVSAIEILDGLGYRRSGDLTDNQYALIHRLQGQEILFKHGVGAAEPHTRLTSLKMALDIDNKALWERARPQNLFGQLMTCFAPEDTMVILAIHGGKELWWDIKWACDVADFIASHPGMDWARIVQRARAQGCYRMLLVAVSLARHYLGAKIPDFVAAAEAADPAVSGIVGRILTRWEADDPGGPPSNKTLSRDRLLLHDGPIRKVSYIMRTWFLPGPQHVPLVALPRLLNFAYIPMGLAHDLIALPVYRAYESLLLRTEQIQDALSASRLVLSLLPVSRAKRKELRRFQEERRSAQLAADATPLDARCWRALGDAWFGLKRYRRAIASYDRALALTPDNETAWKKRHAVFAAIKGQARYSDLKELPTVDEKSADSWAVRAGFLSASKRFADAADASRNALLLDAGHVPAIRIGVNSRLFACDWREYGADEQLVMEKARLGVPTIRPFLHRAISHSEEDHLLVAKLWGKGNPKPETLLWRGERYRHDRIRIAYVSTDLRDHAVGAAIVGVFEHHDKTAFDVTAISLGPDDNGEICCRIKGATDRFIDAGTSSDMQAATLIRNLEIDIAIDLNGLTGEKRPGILAPRPAPVQVNYLGYPGTMAAPFIDYILADYTIIPEESRVHYSEKVVYLPHTYLPYDRKRRIAENTPSRAQEGLPDTGFVFACFSNPYKITPEIFAIWLRLLREVEGSVLWLLVSMNAGAMFNLRQTTEAFGISSKRIVFANHVEKAEDHLARHRLADLYLDTLPYNAHSTCSDALWVGLPVLTCIGRAFPGRVAASLLRAAGLPELVTMSLAEYEERAVFLARNPPALAAIRQKLARSRDTAALFDTAAFTRGLETAYRMMWERQQTGLAPDGFSVPAPR